MVSDLRKSFLKDLRTIKSQMAPSCGISYSKAAISWGNIENRSLSLHCKRHFIANSLAVCIEANSSVSNRSATKLEINGHIVKRPKILLGKTVTKNTWIKNTSVMFSACFSYYCSSKNIYKIEPETSPSVSVLHFGQQLSTNGKESGI